MIKGNVDDYFVLRALSGRQLDSLVSLAVAGHGAVHAPQFCYQATIPAAAARHPQKTYRQTMAI